MPIQTTPDPRTVERTGDAPTGTTTHAHTRTSELAVIGGLQITSQQITEITGEALDAARKAITGLSQLTPPQMQSPLTFWGLKPTTPDFITTMASTQETFEQQLGHVGTEPQSMRHGVAVATAADAAMGPVQDLLTLLRNVRDFSLSSGNRDAQLVYRRALSVAAVRPEIGKAIARFRDANQRAGKKAAATRRSRSKAAVTSATPVTQPATTATPATTTTTTVVHP